MQFTEKEKRFLKELVRTYLERVESRQEIDNFLHANLAEFLKEEKHKEFVEELLKKF